MWSWWNENMDSEKLDAFNLKSNAGEMSKQLAGLTGDARVLELADRMRQIGSARPHVLHSESVDAFRRGEIEFAQVLPLFRHAMIHAGAVVPRAGGRFLKCPVCDAQLDIPALDN